MKATTFKRLLIALLIGSMLLLGAGSLGGQHFRTVPTPTVNPSGHIDYVKGVYILHR